MIKPTAMKTITLGLLLSSISLITPAAEKAAVHVTTAQLKEQTFFPQLSAPATTLSLNESRISAETSGRILALKPRVGDQIKVGDTLAELDCRDNTVHQKQAEAALQAAAARVTLAERQFTRSQSLRKAKNISEELYNQREADVATSRADLLAQRAQLDEAKLNVERCILQAPFDAVVLERLTSEGEWISPGQGVVRLLDNQQLEVSAQIPVDLTESLTHASGIMFEDNHGQYPLQLRILLPVVETRGRNREARLLFPGDTALPGSSGRILWQDPQPHLPADLPVRRNGIIGIFKPNGGTAEFIPLDNALEGQPVAIDLPAGTEIIIEGRRNLDDGDSISVDAEGADK